MNLIGAFRTLTQLASKETLDALMKGELRVPRSVIEEQLRKTLPESVTLVRLELAAPARIAFHGKGARAGIQVQASVPVDILSVRLTQDPAFIKYAVDSGEVRFEGADVASKIALAVTLPLLQLFRSEQPAVTIEKKLGEAIGAERHGDGYRVDLRSYAPVRCELDREVAGTRVWSLVEIDKIRCTDDALIASFSEKTVADVKKILGASDKVGGMVRDLVGMWKGK